MLPMARAENSLIDFARQTLTVMATDGLDMNERLEQILQAADANHLGTYHTCTPDVCPEEGCRWIDRNAVDGAPR
jgi:hypothetical protein